MGPGSTAQGSSSPYTLSPLAPPFTVDRWATTPRPPIEDPYNLRRPIPSTADPFGGRTAGGYGGFGAYGGGLRSAGMPESLYFDVAKPERDDAYGVVRSDSWNGQSYELGHWMMGGDDGGSSGWKDTLGQIVSSSKHKSPLLHGVPAAADFVTGEDASSTWRGKFVASASKNINDTAKWLDPPSVLDKRCAVPSYDLSPDSSGYEQIPYSHIPETLPSVTWHPFQLNPISLDRFRPPIDSYINDPIVHCSSQYAYPVQSFLPQTSVISSSLVTVVPNIVKPSTPSLDAYRNKEPFGQSSVGIKGLPQGKVGYSEPSRIIEDMKPNYFSTEFSLKDYDLPSSRKSVSVKSARDSLDTNSSSPKPLSQQFEASHVLEANTETMVRQLKLPSTCLTLGPGGTSSAYIQSSSDASDQSNLAVDSPCWKGAAASRHFLFGVCEAVDSPSAKETSGGSNQGHVVLPGSIYPEAISSPKRDGDLKETLSFNNHDTEFKLSNDLKSGSDLEAVNTSPSRTERNIPSDAHPLSAATLSDEAEPNEIPSLIIERSFHNTNSQLLVNAIHNLSELLLSSCHNDSGALKEEDYDVLRLALDNFNACVRIKSGPTTGPPGTHSTFHLRGITNTHKETTIKVAGEDTYNVLNQNNHHSIHRSEANLHSPKSGKNANEFLNGILFDGSISKTDNEVTKPMKNVMTETFYDEEENPFKNLWIEAEVSLCSMKYQLQLAHMVMKKQRCKNCCAKDMIERHANVKKPSSPLPACDMYRDGPSVSSDKEVSVCSFSTEAAHAPESLYRNPLEAMELSENHQSEDVDCSVMARFRILKSRMEKSCSMIKADSKNLFDSSATVKASGGSCLSPSCSTSSRDLTAVSKHPPMNIIDPGFSEIANPWPFIAGEPVQRENYCDEISLNSANEPASNHYTFHGPAKRIINGQNSPSSADWEYLLKEELT
ncbi:hypothetical protein QJS04_geneDACA018744 [Acorus gramineus]|uniref:Uncharacterized protein n=1 Tax=Acorus gramineus TaxID=55184 RepID=A0AAV9ABJ7_ACOGR|nr:hypothetical protein QJS04_geneDACA018744 [Acorus gramineus]